MVQNFKEEVFGSPVPVVVYFWAEGDSICREMEKVFDEVGSFYDDVKFLKVNVDEHPHVLEHVDVVSLPDVSVFVDGELKGSSIGSKTVSQLDRRVVASINR